LHPDFRLIVLANRPGFPFLGNDFYATVGDVFAAHTVENPDASSGTTTPFFLFGFYLKKEKY